MLVFFSLLLLPITCSSLPYQHTTGWSIAPSCFSHYCTSCSKKELPATLSALFSCWSWRRSTFLCLRGWDKYRLKPLRSKMGVNLLFPFNTPVDNWIVVNLLLQSWFLAMNSIAILVFFPCICYSSHDHWQVLFKFQKEVIERLFFLNRAIQVTSFLQTVIEKKKKLF